MEHHVFLLRGIGPATHRIMTMKALEGACMAQGLARTRNLLATGNLVVTSDLAAREIEDRFGQALAAGGLAVTWQRRTAMQVRAAADVLRGLPAFADALQLRPAKVQLHFLPAPVAEAGLDELRSLDPEACIARVGAEIAIDYGPSIAESRLTLSRLDRLFGREQTARNWNTVGKIMALL